MPRCMGDPGQEFASRLSACAVDHKRPGQIPTTVAATGVRGLFWLAGQARNPGAPNALRIRAHGPGRAWLWTGAVSVRRFLRRRHPVGAGRLRRGNRNSSQAAKVPHTWPGDVCFVCSPDEAEVPPTGVKTQRTWTTAAASRSRTSWRS